MKWTELSSKPIGEILGWCETQPWCQAMANCQQDSVWHAEGDVWTHTKLVVDQLPLLDEWSGLTPQEKTVLTFTAILHDSGKPETTKLDDETGRIRSLKHSIKGEHLARVILRGLDCDLKTREEICRMVRYHGRPNFLLEKPCPDNEVIGLSWKVNSRLLCLFALADTRGRDTESRSEDTIHLWRFLAEEHGCYTNPFPFAHEHARFRFFRDEKPNPLYVPYENYRCDVTMLSGIPGSGKSTWIERWEPDTRVVSLDDIREEFGIDPTDDQAQVIRIAKERCRDNLRAGKRFVLDATNLRLSVRDGWINLFASYDACVSIVYIEPPFSTILKQNAGRSRVVPLSVINRMVDYCEPPTITECHNLDILRSSNDYEEIR